MKSQGVCATQNYLPIPIIRIRGDYTYDKHSIEDFSLFRTVLSNELFVSEHLFENHLEAKIRFASRFGAKFSYRHFWEKWRGYPTEHLDALSLTAQYYRIRTEHVSLAWGGRGKLCRKPSPAMGALP